MKHHEKNKLVHHRGRRYHHLGRGLPRTRLFDNDRRSSNRWSDSSCNRGRNEKARMKIYLSRSEVAERIGVKVPTLARYSLPEPDALTGSTGRGTKARMLEQVLPCEGRSRACDNRMHEGARGSKAIFSANRCVASMRMRTL